MSQRRGRRFSVVEGYLDLARRRPNLTVVTGALVTRVLLEGGRALGVAYRLHGEEVEEEALAEREVVLCAGAIGSPHTLQLSGIGPRAQLEAVGIDVAHESPGVGANLLDHLANGLFVKTRRRDAATAESLRNLVNWAIRGRGPLTSNLGEAVAFVRTKADLPAPDLELLLAPVLFEDEGLTQPTEHGLTLAVVLLRPRSVGTVTIRSADPEVLPAVDPRYLSDPGGEDMATLLYGLRLARRVPAQEPLASFVERELQPGEHARSDDDLRAHVRALADALSPCGNLPHGVGRDGGRRYAVACPASSVFALRTPRSCPRSRAATRIGRR